MLQIKLEDSPETNKVLDILRKKNLPPAERDLLFHVLNVSRRDQPCGYFGKIHDEGGVPLDEISNITRCLAIEVNPDREMTCPFYDKSLENRCKYKYNTKKYGAHQ